MQRSIKIATRSSPLAVAQAEEVGKKLEEEGYDVEYIKTKSRGDIDRKSPLYKISSTGVFVKSVDELLINNNADISVHSAKDVPSDYIFDNDYIKVLAIPDRKDPRECFVSNKFKSLYSMSRGSVLGSSSIRRINFVKNIRPDLKIENIRGNVDTRVNKVVEDLYDGTIMAKVGLERLSMNEYIKYVFDIDELTPPPGQGALIITVRKDRYNELKFIEEIVNNHDSYLEVMYEKILCYETDMGCSTPVGINCNYKHGRLYITCMICSREFIVTEKFKLWVGDQVDPDAVGEVVSWLRKYI